MAGNIAAGLGGEVLQLRGDEASNHVIVSQSGNTILVQGLNGTTINGETSVSFKSAGLEKTDIRLLGGHDSLEMRGVRASVDHNIEMGLGNDAVVLRNTYSGV